VREPNRQRSATAIRVESTGSRSQAAALVAAPLQPSLFSALEIRDGLRSFLKLLDEPISYAAAPELFCLDLYKDFDIDLLMALAGLKQTRTGR
jgi:hypothetical protein